VGSDPGWRALAESEADVNALVGMLVAVASAVGGAVPPVALPTTVPADRATLQSDLGYAQHIIDDPATPARELASAGQFEQLATQTLASRPRAEQRATLFGLTTSAATAMRADLDAAAHLSRLNLPRKSLPPWRIVAPTGPQTLLGYFKDAQARFHVPWEYLAGIEFVETQFGRVHGLSTAGAEGPMQFMPATWARYGRGDVNDPRAAIDGAARYLTANGAPNDMPDALLHYNPSRDYVKVVTDYATQMRTDPRAYYGYYSWQVIYAQRGRRVILPVGFPKQRPEPLTLRVAPRSG
jgi:membrane-bound lytic murein transglycosylase B